DFHPVELAAHFLLSGSLDSLHETFLLLHESQKILLTRLHLIETRMTKVLENLDSSELDLAGVQTRVKNIRKKLQNCAVLVDKVEAKLETLED
ncbi:hypothetical protein METBIDRAFT_25096, partial [Metschnikowia bicuspidata var. bicuspidata NRRL YB-4993]